jgi:hypothetical protein
MTVKLQDDEFSPTVNQKINDERNSKERQATLCELISRSLMRYAAKDRAIIMLVLIVFSVGIRGVFAQETTTIASNKTIPAIAFSTHPGLDSPGNDIIRWNEPRNFGWSAAACKERCAKDPRCKGVGWDPNQKNYCTMKSKINFPLKRWKKKEFCMSKSNK